jgi:hypothetical protein
MAQKRPFASDQSESEWSFLLECWTMADLADRQTDIHLANRLLEIRVGSAVTIMILALIGQL